MKQSTSKIIRASPSINHVFGLKIKAIKRGKGILKSLTNEQNGRIFNYKLLFQKTRNEQNSLRKIFPVTMRSKRGYGYIDVVVFLLVSMMIIVLALNIFSFLTIKQDMDYFAKEMIDSATVNGCTTGETITRYNELADETGIHPSYSWTANYYNSAYQRVQLGDTIKITLTYSTNVQGFGVFQIPITLTATHSGLSQNYWK
jgi:hypothetical protein